VLRSGDIGLTTLSGVRWRWTGWFDWDRLKVVFGRCSTSACLLRSCFSAQRAAVGDHEFDGQATE
jgi:hypothetical protein